MAIWHKRVLFTKLLGEFLCEANKRGFNIAVDAVKAHAEDERHRPNSLHYLGLACDFVLYTNEGAYLTDTESYIELDVVWESLHPDTYSGIRFDDANHISLTHGGMK